MASKLLTWKSVLCIYYKYNYKIHRKNKLGEEDI